jgi:hypothetical protein
MNTPSTTLPNPRHILTNLINTLTTTLPGTNEGDAAAASNDSNPLKNLGLPQRKILSTLHVLFPPGMLLQALDLLDRGLVGRVVQASIKRDGNEKDEESVQMVEVQKEIKMRETGRGRNEIYQVHSAQPPKSRFSHSHSSTSSSSKSYLIRLSAWNCTCAAFTFSTFPSYTSSSDTSPWTSLPPDHEPNLYGEGGGDEKVDWEFGGISSDGKAGEGVPVCKHLIACLLAEM